MSKAVFPGPIFSGPSSYWPLDGLESVPTCPVCGKRGREIVFTKLADRVWLCAPGEWNLWRCVHCGTGYLDPRPNAATIGLAYSNYFTHGSAHPRKHAPPSAWRRHRIAQRNAYLNQQYGYKLEPAAAHPPRWLSRERKQRWDKLVCFLNWPGKGARVLDLGCGNGGFLLQMKSIGWEVAGVDPDPEAVAQAQAAGLDVRLGQLQADTFPAAHFDAITMGHVIEHLHEPLETLRHCFHVLRPGGVIAIATPNFQSYGRSIFGRDWFALEIPRHLVLFTPDSLRLALKGSGFEPERYLRPRMVSNNIFRRSVLLQRGSDPIREKPALSAAAKVKRLWLTWRADRLTRARPEFTEEIVQLASRPTS